MLWLGSYGPLKHVAVDREVAGNGQRVSFDRGPATDDRGEVNYDVVSGVVLLEEISAIDAVCNVDPCDLMAFVIECSVKSAANEAGVSGY